MDRLQENTPFQSNNLSEMSEAHKAAGLIFLDQKLRALFDLTTSDLAHLLGGMSNRTLQRKIKSAYTKGAVELSFDVTERISLLLGIYKAIKLSVPDKEGAITHFLTVPNTAPLFKNMSVKAWLLVNPTMSALYETRSYFNSKR